ncbi:MAG: helix-turn-helix domain-containing protein [Bacilli bacterium]
MKTKERAFKYERYHIPNVAKAISVVRALSKRPDGMTRSQISACTGFSDSIIFRILYTMSDYGMVVKIPTNPILFQKFVSIAYDAVSGENLVLRAG